MRSSPKPSFGQGLSDSMYSSADGIELPPVARELLALGLDDLGRRASDEPVVGQHSFGAPDLFVQALDLGCGVPVARSLRWFHDRLEDPPFLALELWDHTTTPEHDSSFL